MHFTYSRKQILIENLWNNALSWDLRKKWDKNPILTIPPLVYGNIEDIRIWDDIVFEEIEEGEIRSCKGLKNFIETSLQGIPAIIFDNHNHALYFWIEALRKWIIQKGFELIHMDEHSDLWENPHTLILSQAIEHDEYSWKFTNHLCNVGNYIQPWIECGLVGNMIRLENEFQIDDYMQYLPSWNSVFNLDLDIFSSEMDFISEDKKMKILKNLLPKVQYITIATSPYFIDQWTAIEKLHKIQKILEA